ncbi:MAG: sulfatase-like hydrolase/transferase [Planctomycetaceae bacterium]
MDSTATASVQKFRPSLLSEFLHVSALNSFSVVQPILDSLVNNVAFLRYYDYSPAAVILAILLLTLLIPASLSVCRVALQRLGLPKVSDVVRTCTMALLFLLAMLYAARWASLTIWKSGYFLSDEVFVVPAICVSVWLAWLYYRADVFRQLLSTSAVGVLLFPAIFFLNPNIQEQVLGLPVREYYQPVTARRPCPVVFIVFDGLSGMALLDENYEVDRLRYPSFARLKDRCTFYRNASTVHPRTDHALPAILSGSYPTGLQRPLESEYPLNLFRLLENSRQFEQTIFEPYTQLAPEHLRRIVRQEGVVRQALGLVNTLVRVYERMCLPQTMEQLALDVPHEWFRILPPTPADPEVLNGKIVYLWDSDHDLQVSHFLKCLQRTERPGLRFLHIGLPHDPWMRLSSGKLYRQATIGTDHIAGDIHGVWGKDEWLVNQAWQRYLIQVQYADLCLGRILDRLEESGDFDESMIIVTADHGIAFRAGCSRREPQAETLSDLIPIPLFIKYPHQSESTVSDKNVESIDILPTVAEVLGLPQDPEWDGVPLTLEHAERPRKTVTGGSSFVIEPAFPRRFEYVDRLHRVFGGGSPNSWRLRLQVLPELCGQKASSLAGSVC